MTPSKSSAFPVYLQIKNELNPSKISLNKNIFSFKKFHAFFHTKIICQFSII